MFQRVGAIACLKEAKDLICSGNCKAQLDESSREKKRRIEKREKVPAAQHMNNLNQAASSGCEDRLHQPLNVALQTE